MRIGIAGTGRMGAAIATRLLGLGHEVVIWNRTAAKTAPLEAAGAQVAATPEALAARAEAVITILTDAAAIDVAYRGPGGLPAGDVKAKLFIETDLGLEAKDQSSLVIASSFRSGPEPSPEPGS